MTIVGTRPEIIKMSRVINQFDKFTHHVLVHTGQNYNYELNQVFFEDLDIRKPDYFLNTSGDGSIKTIAKIIDKIVTPIHNLSHSKPKLPRTDTRIDDKTIPRPTPIK